MSARDRILANLRKTAPAAAPAPLLASSSAVFDDPVAELQRHLEAAHAEVIRIPASQLGRTVMDYCAKRGFKNLVVPSGPLPFDLPAQSDVPVEVFNQSFESIKSRLFLDVDAGLTVADCGIADTGTLAHRAGPQQPRTLSLIPPVHLCVLNLNTARIHGSLAQALVAERWAEEMPSNLIFISGPSKTADIQQTLAYGAHGPKELVVFISEAAKGDSA